MKRKCWNGEREIYSKNIEKRTKRDLNEHIYIVKVLSNRDMDQTEARLAACERRVLSYVKQRVF